MSYVTLPGMLCPEMITGMNQFFASAGGSATSLDTADEKVGIVFRSPIAGKIEAANFRVGTFTSSGTCQVSVQDVDSNGLPDGGEDYTANVSVTATGVYESGNLVDGGGNKKTVAIGDLVAIVLKNVSGN